uniref:glucomannan 4-beta-mannosyltransferase n=1 Tax=Amorphophallus konjac TaxID=78372 RepID=E9NYT6_AMOKO|nr:putative mannan synthase [Amorphophallus konjac]
MAIDWARILYIWGQVRTMVLIPAMRIAVLLCLIMSVMLLMEKLLMGGVSLYVKVFRRRPKKVYRWEPVGGDEELGTAAYPMVLVQIPMYNEREVYHLSIKAACCLQWPSDRLIVQVLDDSTDPMIKDLVYKECQKWALDGVNIKYETRANRNGYKAGALKEGMKYSYVEECDYVAIFDADFQADPDYLVQMVPFLIHNPEIGLAQARWNFVNAEECLMTRLQEMSMDYHFKVEQESGSSIHAFFGFNGTAGVWRIRALNEAGGWKDRTTVEDMDLAIRATLEGWKFVYVGDVKVKSELPSTFKAFRYQQHRWSCGPANLVRKMAIEILMTKKVPLWKKFYLLYNFFLTRKIVAHFVTFFFYCVVFPTAVFFPEISIPLWAVVHLPTTITILNACGTPRSIHLIVFWTLFENVMALHRCKGVIIGLLEIGRVNEWVVTEKLGDALKLKPNGNQNFARKARTKYFQRFHFLEIGLALYLIICASYNYMHANNYCYIYIYLQSLAFLVMGLGYVGTFVPSEK